MRDSLGSSVEADWSPRSGLDAMPSERGAAAIGSLKAPLLGECDRGVDEVCVGAEEGESGEGVCCCIAIVAARGALAESPGERNEEGAGGRVMRIFTEGRDGSYRE